MVLFCRPVVHLRADPKALAQMHHCIFAATPGLTATFASIRTPKSRAAHIRADAPIPTNAVEFSQTVLQQSFRLPIFDVVDRLDSNVHNLFFSNFKKK